MAFNESEIKKYSRMLDEFCQKYGPPPHLHEHVKWDFRIENQSIFIFEIRPEWDNPEEKYERDCAKITFVKSRQTWKLYWMRANSKWYSYNPYRSTKSLKTILEIIKEDEFSCFFG